MVSLPGPHRNQCWEPTGDAMAKSLDVILRDIEKLQKQAALIQSKVVDRIRSEITRHGLTVEQLFGAPATSGRTAAAKATRKPRAAGARATKFADGSGNTWHGVGKRPHWLRDALSAGKALEEFLVMSTTGLMEAPEPAAKPVKTAKAARKTAAKAKPAAKKSAKPVAKAPAKRLAAGAGKTAARKAATPSAKRGRQRTASRKTQAEDGNSA
ncbi:MAG: H-NS histone family protein [Burkholderiaceae bacterium]